jgi:hypothetical protein
VEYRVQYEPAESTSGMFGGKFQLERAGLHWCDVIRFYEYFHGDNGAGLGASRQTGWTGLVAD